MNKLILKTTKSGLLAAALMASISASAMRLSFGDWRCKDKVFP